MALTQKPDLYSVAGNHNVLHHFRSYNYLFTLSCVPNGDLANLSSVDEISKLSSKFVIAKSSGKTSKITNGINPDDAKEMYIDKNADPVIKYDSQGFREKPNLTMSADAKAAIQKFNKESPGRFDFYFEDLEVETLVSFDKRTGFSKATKMNFTLVEPYSLAGFVEALQVAAIAAGHPTYKSAPFMLKIEFKGYPDWTDIKDDAPVTIEPATRFFIIRFTDLAIKSDEKGTRYSCKAVPINEMGFGDTVNKLQTSVNIRGNTVGAILEDMFLQINKTLREVNKIRNDPNIKGNLAQTDEYVIKFPKTAGSTIDYTADNEKLKSLKVTELTRSNKAYAFLDPVEEANKSNNAQQSSIGIIVKARTNEEAMAKFAAAKAAKTQQKSVAAQTAASVQFINGANIHDCISAILRDSEYGTSIFKGGDLKKDENDMIDWFNIMIEAVPKNLWNGSRNQPYYTYTYFVVPYKIHYTRVPGFEGGTMDESKVKKQVRRTYNYLYTGKNVDVINFNLEFNHLYFQNDPLRGGNQPLPGGQNAELYPTQADVRRIDNKITEEALAKSSGSAVNETMTSYKLSDLQATGETTGPIEKDPYGQLAQNLHYAILENIGMATLELEIIGDPIYLVQSGIGNIRSQENGQYPGLTDTGSHNHQVGDMYVIVNFRNPKDIKPLIQGGTMEFGEVTSFSGFYKVLTATSKFSNGAFTQRLSMLRMPAQSTDSKQAAVEISAVIDTFAGDAMENMA